MLTLENVSAGYGKVEVLRGVSLRVRKAGVVALLGANGAGKSTIMKTIVGRVRPSAGWVALNGEKISSLPSHRIVGRGIGLVPEGREVFPHMTVQENLFMGAYSRKDAKGVAEDQDRALELFPVLRKRMAQTAGTLSGGEQQMLAISRAIMSHPQLMLLDEPSMGLAPLLVREIFSIIKAIHEQGTTVLIVEQNARMALEIADYAYVLETGRIVREGAASDLLYDQAVCAAYLGS